MNRLLCVGRMSADKRQNTEWNVKTTGCSRRIQNRHWKKDFVVGTEVKRDKCENKRLCFNTVLGDYFTR
jgi:hypothetical protein